MPADVPDSIEMRACSGRPSRIDEHARSVFVMRAVGVLVRGWLRRWSGDDVGAVVVEGDADAVVAQVYGTPPRLQVVVEHTTELSRCGVGEPTTITFTAKRSVSAAPRRVLGLVRYLPPLTFKQETFRVRHARPIVGFAVLRR